MNKMSVQTRSYYPEHTEKKTRFWEFHLPDNALGASWDSWLALLLGLPSAEHDE